MLKRFAQILLKQPEDVPEEEKGNRVALATCAVLLEAAHIDDEFTDVERKHILAVMQQRFNLTEEESERLMQEALGVWSESTDLWHFTHQVNQTFSTQEKIEIMEEVWRIFYSDGTLDGHEDQLAHKLSSLLNLNQPQLIEAKMKVLREIRGEG